ncbi:unnamed protein product [Dovyalis caffra]|uniref:Uncharacterized protein n=1 Tax=Dovyalis caffra TaxID=77055 RepID=A0AAV1QXM1_9ROSI|nr:unnamed protein product [Dovyalis caffra]
MKFSICEELVATNAILGEKAHVFGFATLFSFYAMLGLAAPFEFLFFPSYEWKETMRGKSDRFLGREWQSVYWCWAREIA